MKGLHTWSINMYKEREASSKFVMGSHKVTECVVAGGIRNKSRDVCALGKFPIYLGFQIAIETSLHFKEPEKGIFSSKTGKETFERVRS